MIGTQLEHAIYTRETSCQDCYRCVRTCPVKAISVGRGHAAIDPKLCVACGACVDACPNGAKIVRNDIDRAKDLLSHKDTVFISLAPSFAGEFRNMHESELLSRIKDLGFAGVSETALGADIVTRAVADQLSTNSRRLYLSSACPAAVDFVRMYLPEHASNLTSFLSPMLAHARYLKSTFGDDCGVVFIGPCIAKKKEADSHPDLVDVALTFDELRTWIAETSTSAPEASSEDRHETVDFVPSRAGNGSIYPVAGGMNATLEAYKVDTVQKITVSGLMSSKRYLEKLDGTDLDAPVFVELLACEGGCIAGPCTSKQAPLLLSEAGVRNYAGKLVPVADDPVSDIRFEYDATVPQAPERISEKTIRSALEKIGKFAAEDELNCGACGYDTCRDCARAIVAGKAESDMCVSYLRHCAQRKANALLRSMPSGVVIVDKHLQIVECNENFAILAGSATAEVFAVRPGLGGAYIDRIFPMKKAFQGVLDTGKQFSLERYQWGQRLVHVNIFEIEPHQTVGGIVVDVTDAETRRAQITNQAREVIDRNVTTVQEIACMLGEHMAETETLLRAIAEDYGDRIDYNR